jgi:phosphinothricin acetyltransferase
MATPEQADGGDARERAANVRQPCAGDLPAMLEIWNWATCHTAANFRTEPDTLDHWVQLSRNRTEAYPWFVAQRGDRVVGFAMASPLKQRCGFAPTAEVTVYVHPDHLRTGTGSGLYAQLIPALGAEGFQSLVAMITVPNTASERLHERFGFRRVGVLQRVGWKFGRWHDVTYWQLVLRNDEAAPRPLRHAANTACNESGIC